MFLLEKSRHFCRTSVQKTLKKLSSSTSVFLMENHRDAYSSSLSLTLCWIWDLKRKRVNQSIKNFTKNEQRYLHHLNSNFDSAICCSGLLHRCQWNRCLIGHGRQRNGNNEGGKTTSDSQWSLLHLDLKIKYFMIFFSSLKVSFLSNKYVKFEIHT